MPAGIARITLTGRRGDLSLLDFHYLVARNGGIELHTEQMELGLFTVAEIRASFTRAGLQVRHDADGLIGRGLYVGRSPAAPL